MVCALNKAPDCEFALDAAFASVVLIPLNSTEAVNIKVTCVAAECRFILDSLEAQQNSTEFLSGLGAHS